VRWDGRSGIVLDAASRDVPLVVLSFGIWRLDATPVALDTEACEHVLLLVGGRLRLRVDGQTIDIKRPGGPFGGYPDAPQATCVYVPREKRYSFEGEGEVVLFTSPAAADMPVRYVAGGERQATSRGAAFWRRDVVTLVEPFDVSTNLIVGETRSPPGLWSGIPPHRHDEADPGGGQSDHEEVYCFRVRGHGPADGPGAVQLLYGAEGLDEAYPVGDWSVVALPGGCHPVVAGPMGEIVYIWGMASRQPQALRLWDVPDSAFLKDVEAAFRQLAEATPRRRISANMFRETVAASRLDDRGKRVLAQALREYGFDVDSSGSREGA
jgi:5-deoxy-glucuronate isomerase